jgi:hypothetical protein
MKRRKKEKEKEKEKEKREDISSFRSCSQTTVHQ